MKIVQSLIAASLLFGTSAIALAVPGNGGPLPSVRTDIRKIAQQSGFNVGKGSRLVITPAKIQFTGVGHSVKVSAKIYEKSTFTGGPVPLKKAKLMLEGEGSFTVMQTMEGPAVSGHFSHLER